MADDTPGTMGFALLVSEIENPVVTFNNFSSFPVSGLPLSGLG